MMGKRNGIWQPWFLSAMLTLGFGIVWAIVVGYSGVFLDEATRGNQIHRGITILEDGTPVVKTYWPNRLPPVTFETLDGEPMEPTPESRHHPDSAWLAARREWRGGWLPRDWAQRLERLYDNGTLPWVNWYLMPHGERDGSACLEGYDSESKLCVGYIGRNGFQRERPSGDACFSIPNSTAGPFRGAVVSIEGRRWEDYSFSPEDILVSSSRSPVILLVSGGRLLRVNLRDRSVRPVWESSEVLAIGILDVETPPGRRADKDAPRVKLFLALRTASEVVLLDVHGEEAGRFVIPESLRPEAFQFYLLSETTAMFQSSHRFFREPVERYRFFWVDGQGKVEKEPQSVDLPRHAGLAPEPWFVAVAVPVPAVVTPTILFAIAGKYVDSGECSGYASALGVVFCDHWFALIVPSVLGIVLAWVCYRRQKRYDQPWTWVWVVTVFLFGLPGFVGYLFHRRWPAIERCPSCQAEAPRDREACYACGQDFPRPAMKGKEVFA